MLQALINHDHCLQPVARVRYIICFVVILVCTLQLQPSANFLVSMCHVVGQMSCQGCQVGLRAFDLTWSAQLALFSQISHMTTTNFFCLLPRPHNICHVRLLFCKIKCACTRIATSKLLSCKYICIWHSVFWSCICRKIFLGPTWNEFWAPIEEASQWHACKVAVLGILKNTRVLCGQVFPLLVSCQSTTQSAHRLSWHRSTLSIHNSKFDYESKWQSAL